MSQAIAQSATQLVGESQKEENYSFATAVKVSSERTAKGSTRESKLLNRQKLLSAVCADYRCHYPSIYGKTERLPMEVFTKIESAVDEYLNKQLARVNVLNVQTYKRAFAFSNRTLTVFEKEILEAHNVLALKEQKLGIEIFIGQTEKRLADLEKKPTPDYDAEKQCKARLMQLNVARDFILGELSKQDKLSIETKTK